MASLASPRVPVSWGELLDKASILEIKLARIADASARGNVAKELRELSRYVEAALRREGVAELFAALKAVNEELWDIEDAIRREEALQRFDSEFIALARAVYRTNDKRAELKREINRSLNSELVEEKSYWTAKSAPEADAPAPVPAWL